MRTLLSERATFNVDRKAGLLQVTDFPERLDRVAIYLDAVQDRVHRQVQIDARVIEVELNDEKAAGVDWAALAAQDERRADRRRSRVATRQTMNGLRVTDVGKLLGLLAEQGTVTVVANPRLLTLNNEPAIVRTETMSFSVTPQIAGDSVRDAEPDADRDGRPRWSNPTCSRASPTARRSWCPASPAIARSRSGRRSASAAAGSAAARW